jgi:hypothetical protein
VACAALLHDAVEDHAGDIAPGGRQAALAVLAGRVGERTAALVAAVTNPVWEPGRDEHEQYREHVLASLRASAWARVIKASDVTDNAVGIIHTTGPKLSKLAGRYGALVSALRELILRRIPRWPPTSRTRSPPTSTTPRSGSPRSGVAAMAIARPTRDPARRPAHRPRW